MATMDSLLSASGVRRRWRSTVPIEVFNSENPMIRAKCYSVALSIWSATFLTWHSFSEAAYPERAVRIIVAYGVGGGADLVARVVGGKLSEKWGKPVVIENRTGANGTIGLAAVVGATADGHTLALYTSTHPIAPYLYKLNYDP